MDLYNNLTTIAAVVIGSLIGFVVQWMMFRAQEKKDKREEMNALNREKLEVYGQILKVDADNEMSRYMGDGYEQFHTKVYTEQIRPLVYEKIFLLDPYVANKIRSIDSFLSEERMIGNPHTFNHATIIKTFYKMINYIEKKISWSQVQINKMK